MKNILLLFFGIIFSQIMAAQEFAAQGTLSIEALEEKPEISIDLTEISLPSFFKKEVFTREFRLTEVNFEKHNERSLDLIAMMEAERAYRESIASNSFRFPVDRNDHSGFSISKNMQLYSRASNFDFYTGETKNPAYRELQSGFLKPGFDNSFENTFFRPYSYSPYNYFLR